MDDRQPPVRADDRDFPCPEIVVVMAQVPPAILGGDIGGFEQIGRRGGGDDGVVRRDRVALGVGPFGDFEDTCVAHGIGTP